jgi:replicative superfamily II helicase
MTSALFPPQQAILDHGIIDLGFSAVVSLPTGAGKTTIAEMAMDRALARGERVAYLTPLKALAEEKIRTWDARWPESKVGIFTGDYATSSGPVPYRDADVIICTYERLDGILRHWRRHLGWLSKLGLVVVDELHLLMDPTRGPRLEGTISRLSRVNPFCRVLGLSATVSNHRELAAWLDGVSYHSNWRPVRLKHEVRRFKRLADKTTLVTDLVKETTSEKGQSLVFASSRRRAEQLAKTLTAKGVLAAHHHAGLSIEVRRDIEAKFRAGALNCLVATPTLEMGLNLPCRTVIIADSTRWNGETFAPLPVWNYLQRAGRAGRPGQDGEGRAILLAPCWSKSMPDYERANPEPIRSQLAHPARLAEQILIEVASRCCRTRAQLRASFLPATLAQRQDPEIGGRLDDCLATMLEAGFIEEDEKGFLRPTSIGWVAVRHQLTPATAKHLIALQTITASEHLTDFDLLLHHCWDIDLRPQLPIAIEVVEALEREIADIPSILLDNPPPTDLAPRAVAAGVVMGVTAWRYLQDGDLSELCQQLDLYPSDANLLRENLVRLLLASTELHTVLDDSVESGSGQTIEAFIGPRLHRRLRRLALQLEYGLPGKSVLLTRIPGCGGKLARRLFEAGIEDLEDLCLEEPTTLAEIPGIGTKRATGWILAANELVKDTSPFDEASSPKKKPRSLPCPPGWPPDIEPGRLRRAMQLRVIRTNDGFCVSGGADEHLVVDDSCDCADYMQNGSGWWCKHRLATRLFLKDSPLSELAARVSELKPPASLAGHLADLALGRRWCHE